MARTFTGGDVSSTPADMRAAELPDPHQGYDLADAIDRRNGWASHDAASVSYATESSGAEALAIFFRWIVDQPRLGQRQTALRTMAAIHAVRPDLLGGRTKVELAKMMDVNERTFLLACASFRRLLEPRGRGDAEILVGGWDLIETAPKDGTRVLLLSGGEVEIGYWSTSVWVKKGGAWVIYEARSDTIELNPTYWMRLPLPPVCASARLSGEPGPVGPLERGDVGVTLAPCLFCGAKTTDRFDPDGANEPAVALHSYPASSACSVECVNCGAVGPLAADAEKAVELWNRAQPKPVTEYRLESWNGVGWECGRASHRNMTAETWRELEPSVRRWWCRWRVLATRVEVESAPPAAAPPRLGGEPGPVGPQGRGDAEGR